MSLWAAKWFSESRLSGRREYLLRKNLVPVLFRTRREARAFIEAEYGYIRRCPDLRVEPHGWRMPQAIRVNVNIREVSA